MTKWEQDLEWCADAVEKIREQQTQHRSEGRVGMPRSRLGESDWRLIQAMQGVFHYKEIARMFGLHDSSVYDIWYRDLDA